ncbi:sperm flagellar protein 1 isoform X1 [Vulpes lagopus]|uniref:sperm flagellar protein 1 isoform X1 n=1 Tax=Vulpes lagopus TaxID=494514 RepID=UPI001BC9CD0A|nr:sperm flagellar protein 1 isoform X1 [Vulpes lagopus]
MGYPRIRLTPPPPPAAPLPPPSRPSLHSLRTQSAIPVSILQESAEQTELLGTRGCDAKDRSMRAGRGGASTDSAEAAPGGTPEAQEAGHQLLTGATLLKHLPLLCGSFPGSRKPHLADKCGRRESGRRSLALETMEEIWGSLGMSEPDLTVHPGASFRSWLPRMALATWMWVCPGRPEGKVPWTPREGGSSGKEAGSSYLTRPGDPPTLAGKSGAGCSWEGRNQEGEDSGEWGGRAWPRDFGRVRVGPKVQASAKQLPTPGRAGCPGLGLQDIARQCRATQASSSRSPKKSRSCWPLRRLCRSCR